MMNEMMMPQTSMSMSMAMQHPQPQQAQLGNTQTGSAANQPVPVSAFDNNEALKSYAMQAMYWPAYHNQLAQFSQFAAQPQSLSMNSQLAGANAQFGGHHMFQQHNQQPQQAQHSNSQGEIKPPMPLCLNMTPQQQTAQAQHNPHELSVVSSGGSAMSENVSPCSPDGDSQDNTSGSVCDVDVSPSPNPSVPPSMVNQPFAFNAFHTPTGVYQGHHGNVSLVNKRKANPVPSHLKDSVYWERRKRNNDSAKRSREQRRQKEEQIAMKAVYVEQENLALRAENGMLRQELERLQLLVYNGVNAAAINAAVSAQ